MKKVTQDFIEEQDLKIAPSMDGYIIPYSQLGKILEDYHEEQITIGEIRLCPYEDVDKIP